MNTPITDAEEREVSFGINSTMRDCRGMAVPSRIVRNLERELAQAQAEKERLKEPMSSPMRGHYDALLVECRNCGRALTEARAKLVEAEALRKVADELSAERISLTTERDELKSKLAEVGADRNRAKATLSKVWKDRDSLRAQLEAVTKDGMLERDSLARQVDTLTTALAAAEKALEKLRLRGLALDQVTSDIAIDAIAALRAQQPQGGGKA